MAGLPSKAASCVIGIDVGGTNTDCANFYLGRWQNLIFYSCNPSKWECFGMAQNSDNSRHSSWSGACHWSCYEKGRIRYPPSGICQDWDNGESFTFSSWTQAGGNFLFLEVKWLAATVMRVPLFLSTIKISLWEKLIGSLAICERSTWARF
jgi:hypothetical protein